MATSTSPPVDAGHLFVVRGDLTKIHSDVVLIPTDDQLNVTRHWWSMFPAEQLEVSTAGWKRYRGPLGDGLREGAAQVDKGRCWLFISGRGGATPEWLVQSTVAALTAVAGALGDETRRVPRLVTLPLPGTGAGGLARSRGRVVELLLQELHGVAADLCIDIALILGDDRDAAAVQARRGDATHWKSLPAHLQRAADALGDRAAAGLLSLFIGAGVSKPLGLPDWAGLVAALRSQAGLQEMSTADGCLDRSAALAAAAQEAQALLDPDVLTDLIQARFKVESCTLAHALLADLRIREAVTTNYDTAYEVAVAGLTRVQPDEAVKVLTRSVVASDRPWLLKLHGDAKTGKGIVLTTDQYGQFSDRARPQIGMVQSLLMTGHLLFVGYSLFDQTFIQLAGQVREVLAEADSPRESVGTVVPITRDDEIEQRAGKDLTYLPMPVSRTDADRGARLLQVFLDRVCWRATTARSDSMQYLLDNRYDGMTRTDAEAELRTVAHRLQAEIPSRDADSPGWKHLTQALRRLGADLPVSATVHETTRKGPGRSSGGADATPQAARAARRQRVIVALVGSAVGDALGAPFEFGPSRRFTERFPEPARGLATEMCGGGGWRPGEWTDDTQMALLLAASLLEKGGLDEADIYRRFVGWADAGPQDVGISTRAVLTSGRGWQVSASEYFAGGSPAAGNGSIMRTTPAAIFFARQGLSASADAARRISDLTHGDPHAGDGCGVLHRMIAVALGGEDPLGEIDAALAEIPSERR